MAQRVSLPSLTQFRSCLLWRPSQSTKSAASGGGGAGHTVAPWPEPKLYCMQQFNNQLFMLYNALAVANATQRTLVLPPFMWMERQDAERQEWFPFSHFFDLAPFRSGQQHGAPPVVEAIDAIDAIEMEDFLDLLDSESEGGDEDEGEGEDSLVTTLPFYYYPPYVLVRPRAVPHRAQCRAAQPRRLALPHTRAMLRTVRR